MFKTEDESYVVNCLLSIDEAGKLGVQWSTAGPL